MPAIAPFPNHPGPKKETARITVLPDPPSKPPASVQIKKTQPLITMPDRNIATAPIKLAPTTAPVAVEEGIPMSLCWGVLGISAIILLIQIWNYVA
ncbi:MAG: hypothetical protein ABJB69_08420 [Spartobacteria bacterium]